MNRSEINILLVEDLPLLQTVFKRQTQKLGFTRVTIAPDGASAVELARNKNFSMIFMDVNLPQVDGIEATRKIRQQELPGHRVPIIGLTAYGDREACLSAGMDDFLQKPVLLEELFGVIDKWARSAVAEPAERRNS